MDVMLKSHANTTNEEECTPYAQEEFASSKQTRTAPPGGLHFCFLSTSKHPHDVKYKQYGTWCLCRHFDYDDANDDEARVRGVRNYEFVIRSIATVWTHPTCSKQHRRQLQCLFAATSTLACEPDYVPMFCGYQGILSGGVECCMYECMQTCQLC